MFSLFLFLLGLAVGLALRRPVIRGNPSTLYQPGDLLRVRGLRE